MKSISSNMDYLAILVPLLVPSPKCYHSAYCRILGYFFGAFCLILLLELTPGLGQSLEDSSNHTYPLTIPNLRPFPLIKTTEVMLAITLPKWMNKNNGFTYILSIRPSCQKSQKAFPLCKTSFYQCIPSK
jgi:hypothetical protein